MFQQLLKVPIKTDSTESIYLTATVSQSLSSHISFPISYVNSLFHIHSPFPSSFNFCFPVLVSIPPFNLHFHISLLFPFPFPFQFPFPFANLLFISFFHFPSLFHFSFPLSNSHSVCYFLIPFLSHSFMIPLPLFPSPFPI